MKNLDFLTNKLFVTKGIYDNHKIYENSIESIKEAIKNNLGLFLNISLTSDNKLIVYSGEDLSKIMNIKDKINETTYDEINYLFHYHVPLLDEVLKIINGSVPVILYLNVNKKNKELLNILSSYNKVIAITSKNNNILNWLGSNIPNIVIGEIADDRKILNFRDFFGRLSMKSDFKLLDIDKFDSINVRKYKLNNCIVLGYLVNNKEKYNSFKDTFDNLIVDNYKNLDL